MALLRFFLLCSLVDACQGVFSLVATPSSLNPPNDSQLDLTCSLTPGTSDVNRVMVIQLAKVEGTQRIPLASVVNGEEARFNTDFTGKEAKVDGKISSFRRAESFLELTVEKPDDANGGEYVCVMSFLDHTSLLQRLEATAIVTGPTTGAKPQGPGQGSNLVTLLLEQQQTLRHQVANLSQQIQSLPACSGAAAHVSAAGKVAFLAQPTSQEAFGVHPLIFDKVMVNVGHAYNGSTGCFVAPLNGLYLIMASISATYGKTIADLQVNGQSKAQLAATGNDQTSVSLVLQLRANDMVWLQGIFASHNDTEIFADGDSSFSGFLL